MAGKAVKREIAKVVAVAAGALLLLLFAYQVFYGGETSESAAYYTEEEIRLSNILSAIEGVGNVSVIIHSDEEGTTGVVVVCDGGDDLMICSRILQAVHLATGAGTNEILIYKTGE